MTIMTVAMPGCVNRHMGMISLPLLEDYIKDGDVEVVYFKSQDNRNDKLWQLVGVEDCLYKNRNLSRYLLFGDLDERLTPIANFTIAEYISNAMVENPRCGALSFDPRWVIRTSTPPTVYQGKNTLRKHLPMLVFHNTSAPPLQQGDTAKYALDPNKVILAWVHDVRIFVPGFKNCNVCNQNAYIRWDY
ncbi:hypothetical protein ANCDUO_01987 [Ancylostoma duodenale]|uniref:Glycosyltransferase family 92 protein n=1 Tax=Ancylostoma duodenale TaxID=51022 RepID=A0A0C2H1M3_9BILA|nr:hypothetical protein ANCDUO_01987 [Ancylostoma duodenale]